MTSRTTFILLGATGDLSRKKIIPSVYSLFIKGLLPSDWQMVMFVRKEWDRAELANFIGDVLTESKDDIDRFISHLDVCVGDLDDVTSYEKLHKMLTQSGERLFYLAISPALYSGTISHIRDSGLVTGAHDKLLIEKPFGRDKDEASLLNTLLASFLTEDQICRVDHYLAKSAMESLRTLPQKEIKNVRAVFVEDKTIGKRGAFYDATGAFLDVGQNHLLMMLATALSPLARQAALKGLQVVGDVSRGQYDGYLVEGDVRAGSQTETYFSAKLRTGSIDCVISGGKGFDHSDIGVYIEYADGDKQAIDFGHEPADALTPHAKLILAALNNDQSLFVSKDESDESWRIASLVSDLLRSVPLRVYPKGGNLDQITNTK